MPVSIADINERWDTSQMDIQQRELFYSRVNIINYLAVLEVSPASGVSTGVVGNLLSDTTALEDITMLAKKGCTTILNHADDKFTLTKTASSVAAVIKNSKVGKAASAVSHAFSEVKEKLKALISKGIGKIIALLKKVYAHSSWVLSFLSDMSGWLVESITESVSKELKKLIPGVGYIQGAADLYAGVKKAIDGVVDSVSIHRSGKGVALLDGHPNEIAYWLENHMVSKALSGTIDSLIAVTKLTVEAAGDAAGGFGSIFGYVSGAITRLIKFIEYFIQRVNLYRVLKKAKDEQSKLLSQNSITGDKVRFNRWFSSTLKRSPVIGALVLHSGSAASSYNFLKLMDHKGQLISDVSCIKGMKHIENMKKLSGKYIRSYSGEYSLTFSSGCGWQNELLKQQLEAPDAYQITTDVEAPKWHALQRSNAIRRHESPLKRQAAFRRKASI